MSSISERVMAEVVRRLGLISTASGYYTDAGASVHRARASFEVDALPAISVWDAGEQPINSTGSGRSESMTLTLSIDIDAHAEADADETGEQSALAVAEKLRAAIEAHEFRTPTTPPAGEPAVRLTISIGVASLPIEDEQDEVELIGRADQALYEAKRTGRNRVVPYRKPAPAQPAEEPLARSDAS